MAQSFKFGRGVVKRLKEMMISNPVTTGLRNALSALSSNFYEAPTTPALRDTHINRDAARALYYNIDPNVRYGAFVAKNIVDGTADYIGLPILSVGDENLDDELNSWVQDHWAPVLRQLYRTYLRDSNAWIRLRLPYPSPLLATGEELIPQIEVYDSDRVTPYYDPVTQELKRVEILTEVYIEDEPFNPANIYATGARSHGRAHEIIEIITPQQYLYWDATENLLLEDFTTNNDWNFVPLVEVFNDYDEALHGGSSDLETVYPLLQPFHDIFSQTRTAFKYHANPKVQIQVNDVLNFVKNNFPDAIQDGQFTGKVSWRDRDVFFMETGEGGTTNESMSFVTAALNVGDAQTLLELIIDCMCMAAGVTEGVLFRARAEGLETSEGFQRFKKKIERKRDGLAPYLQLLIRMSMFVTKKNPMVSKLSWASIDTQDLIDTASAFNNEVTALEVLSRSSVISKSTYRASVRKFIPAMKVDAEEDKNAQADVAKENSQQIDLQKQMTAVTTPVSGNGNINGSIGPNSATRARVAKALPMDVVPTPPGG